MRASDQKLKKVALPRARRAQGRPPVAGVAVGMARQGRLNLAAWVLIGVGA